MSNSPNVEGRLSKVEAGLLSQESKLNDISSTLSEIAKHNLQSQKPQWSNLIGLASVIITVMALAFAPVYTTMHKTENEVKSQYSEFINHIKDGHPKVQIEAINQNDADIRQNKESLQVIREALKDLRAESIEDRGRFDERIKALEP